MAPIMHSRRLLVVGFALVVAGCWSNEARQNGNAGDPAGDEERAASQGDELTHSVVEETAYYTDGPQQGRPPDGQLEAGTKVELIRESGSYSLVRTEEGVEAYVAADSLKELDR
ncbi:MAG: hypothetical protein WD847_14185 [Pirellulales bacterium]